MGEDGDGAKVRAYAQVILQKAFCDIHVGGISLPPPLHPPLT